MKVFRLQAFALALVVVCLCLNTGVFAQAGASSASVSQGRAAANSTPQPSSGNSNRQSSRSSSSQPRTTNSGSSNYYAPPVTFNLPKEVAVEEYVNYHKHNLPRPKVGQGVAMDTRWGNDEVSGLQREAVLQIGFTTAEVSERTDLRPLNLALVIDKSGSMADGDKMSRVKESLRTMIGKLRSEDIVSIVVFDTSAEVLFPANRIGNGYELRRAIDSIQPGGSTNLHGGLMLGYREANKNFQKGATNRVILLTDGIANVGTIEPNKIAAESSEFNGQGLDLSTIGVGQDLNNDLLRTLAKAGRGLYHFISDYQDIDKVFVNEVQSLVSQVAKRVEVNVDYDSNIEIEKIYGYSPRYRSNGFSVTLDDMNNGLTQVIMARFRAKNQLRNSASVRVRLSYFDVQKQRMVEENQALILYPAGRKFAELLADPEVKKNYTIAELAQSLYDMREAAQRRDFWQAENFINTSVSETNRRFPNMEDNDIRYILNIVEDFQRDLRAFNRQRGNDDCGKCN
jgi:Mg-chelatase subunit ChlD